ncbi:MAG: HEAT repeat domain-containing protein [Gemmatimonadaceae bacterium]|nr:HEAT repeat domain-containing protein [Gemmatimonadaceae bacterium]
MPLGYRRSTPVSVPALDARTSRGTIRALALLVDRLTTLGLADEPRLEDVSAQPSIRDALRALTGRVREAPLVCRVMDGALIFEGEPVDRAFTRDDPLAAEILQRCVMLRIGSIAIRQGASPGELLTLASLLARAPRGDTGAGLSTETPTTMSSIAPEGTPRELLRSWSVLVTPADVPSRLRVPTPADGIAIVAAPGEDGTSGSPVASALSRLAGANADDVANRAAEQLILLITDAELRDDAAVIEGIGRAVMAQIHAVGSGPGRLALERIVRRLQKRRALELLAQAVPHAIDRLPLLELLARAGEAAVDVLVQQLMAADDSPSRRAYFDSIVSLDLGATQLFALLQDDRWFVVRNAVAILGEMGVESADDAMLPLLDHPDDRIRIATARALIRLGTSRALQGLHVAVDDKHAEVRRIAAVAYGLSGSNAQQPGLGVRPPAARLASALDRETDDEVAIEMVASLGRLGSADAIQRLLRIALPPQQLQDGQVDTTRRESWLRVAAIESLVRARGSAVRDTIDALVSDPDPDVASTALRYRM